MLDNFVHTRLRPPLLRGLVHRPALVGALAGVGDRRVVLIDAPVGYGKTSLLVDWLSSQGESRRVAWISLEKADSDPTRLLAHLVAAIRQQVPGFAEGVDLAVRVPRSRLWGSAVPRLLGDLEALGEPFVIVADDYHLLKGRLVQDLIDRLIGDLPPTTQLIISSRIDPPLALARLRASGSLFELHAADLRFDETEGAALLRNNGVELDPDDLRILLERTEGWPAGLYLATLSLRADPDRSGFIHRFAGTHRNVADYLSEEVVRRQPEATRIFLVRTSILNRMCAPLCDTLVDGAGAQDMLEELERSNLFVVPLDDERTWYRYHHLFGEMLRAELARTDASLVFTLHRQASAWFEAQGMAEEATEHALAARDGGRAGNLIAGQWLALLNAGRLATVMRWLDALGEDAIAASPPAALAAAWVAALTGHAATADRWLRAAELRAAELGGTEGRLPDGTSSIDSAVAIIRGLFGFCGLGERRDHLVTALGLEPTDSVWRPYLLWGLAQATLLAEDAQGAERILADALQLPSERQPLAEIMIRSELAIARLELGDVPGSRELARSAERLARDGGLATDTRSSGAELAVGLSLIADGELVDGHAHLERALELRQSDGVLSPWPTLLVLAALAPVRATLGDVPGARELILFARQLIADVDDAGDLPRRIDEAERLLRATDDRLEFGQHLTERELTILRMLGTQLSQREISRELYVSVNTVKTHSRAIYRKLGVSSRREAVRRAEEMDLIGSLKGTAASP